MRIYNRGFRAESASGGPIPGAHVTLWDAQTGGTQITTGIQDLTGATIAGGVLVCDAWGYAPSFQDTMDRADIWAIGADTGEITGVDRVHLEPDDVDSRLDAFEASVGQVGGPAGPLDASGLIPSAQIPGGGGGGSGPSLSGTVIAETTYGISSSAGSAATASRGDHTHGTPALASSAPGNSAVGDTAAVGTATAPARADHVHAREAFGTPGASAVADTAAAGSATTVARSDHRHGRESFGNVVAQTSFGASSSSGTATTPARSDHTHGTPTQDPAEALRQGLIPAGRVETRSRLDCGVQSSAGVSGALYLVPIQLPAGFTVNNITFVSGTVAAGTPTHYWFSLHDNNRVMLAVTADQLTAAWGTGTKKTLAIAQTAAGAAASFTTTYAGLHFLGVMVASTTMPSLAGAGSVPAVISQDSPAFGGADTGLTTPPAFPFTAAAPTLPALPAYAYTS